MVTLSFLIALYSSVPSRLLVSTDCKLNASEATIAIQGFEAEAPVDSLGAKLIKCSTINLNPKLWLVEIDSGESGTSNLSSAISVMVLEKSESTKDMKVLLSKKIIERSSAGGKKAKEEFKTKLSYELVLEPKADESRIDPKWFEGGKEKW